MVASRSLRRWDVDVARGRLLSSSWYLKPGLSGAARTRQVRAAIESTNDTAATRDNRIPERKDGGDRNRTHGIGPSLGALQRTKPPGLLRIHRITIRAAAGKSTFDHFPSGEIDVLYQPGERMGNVG